MSSIFIAETAPEHAERAAQRLSCVPWGVRGISHIKTVVVASARVDDPFLWGNAHDPASGTTLWLGGRVAFEESEWRRAETLPYEGGLACRLLIDIWLRDGKDNFPSLLNGAFGVVVHDHGSWHVFTDAMGIYPFYRLKNRPFALATHPDVLADFASDLGLPCSRDWVTVAEALATGTAAQPFTLYQEIEQLEPSSHYLWTEAQPTGWRFVRRSWWEPWYLHHKPEANAEALVEELAVALREAARLRTLSRLGKPLVFLSGGADSRVALFGAQDSTKVTGFTLCDVPNEEVDTARSLARAAGAAHTVYRRDLDYYPRNAPEVMRVAGGMWNFIDAHYSGALDEVMALEPGVVLTGCYADYMFKGLSLNRRARTLFGRDLPLFGLAEFNDEHYHPHFELAEPHQTMVRQRAASRFAGLEVQNYQRQPHLFEDRRLRPLSREADAAGRSTLWRTLPWDPLLADRQIIRVCGKMAASQKLNGLIFGKAVARMAGVAGRKIRNNNYGTPIDAGEWGRVLWFLWGVAKRKAAKLSPAQPRPGHATNGSWPDHRHVLAHSPVIRETWHAVPNDRRREITEILGRNPWDTSLQDWAHGNAMLFSRIYSRVIWEEGRCRGTGRPINHL